MSNKKELTIEVTQQCMNECIYCSSVSTPETKQKLSTKDIINCIHQASNLKFTHLNLSGGEPLLHPGIIEVIKEARNSGLFVTLYSSGVICQNNSRYYLTRDFFKQLKEAGLSVIIFNLQAGSDNKYREIIGNKHGIQYLCKSLYEAVQSGLKVELNFVPMTVNKDEFKEVVEIAETSGVTQINILNLVKQGRASDDLLLNKQELNRFIETVSKIKTNIKFRIGNSFEECGKHKCTAGHSKVVIRYDGQALPCERFKFQAKDRNNIKTREFSDIYSELKNFKQFKDSNKQLHTAVS